jgi:hypothetical protein
MKFMRVTVSMKLIMDLLTTGNEVHIRVIEGLPEGTKFAYMMPSLEYGRMELVVEHESFPELRNGQLIPPLPLPRLEKIIHG